MNGFAISEAIGAGPANTNICIRAAIYRIVPPAAHNAVIAPETINHIGAITTQYQVIAGRPVNIARPSD